MTDAFGKMLLDQHNSEKEVFYAIERDDDYLDINSAQFYFSDYDEWMPQEQYVIDQATGDVLDIGAGGGRHSLYLQKRGHKVTATDNSSGAVEVCKLRGIKEAKLGSMLDLESLPSAETIVIMGNTFPIYHTRDLMIQAFNRFYEITPANGKVILLIRIFNEEESKQIAPYHASYLARNIELNREIGNVHMRVRYLDQVSEWFDFYAPTADEYTEILSKTDWEIRYENMVGNLMFQILAK